MFKERKDAVPVITGAKVDPIVFIMPLALEKMYYYVKECSKEIGWLGLVSKFDNKFLVEDVYLFKQQVHSATCEITPGGIAEFVTDLFVNNPDNAERIINGLKLWGHSHVNMTVSPSAQDNSQMNTFADANEWFLRVIANKNGEMEFSLFDFKQQVQYKNIKWCEYKVPTEHLEEAIKAEIKEKVSEFTYAYGGVGKATARSYYGWDEDDYYGHGVAKKNETTVATVAQKPTVSQTKLKEVEEVDEETAILDYSEYTYVKVAGGAYKAVKRHDMKGALKPEIIDAEFTAKELGMVAQCNLLTEVEDLVTEFNPSNSYSFEDLMVILEYATNKYPV